MSKQKETIAFEDLMKVDIRICRILTCEPVPKTDKLFEMTIDTGIEGEEPRTVVSGIADQFNINGLIGFHFPFVLNLEPRKIRGILSEAMIVLSDVDGKYVKIGTIDMATEKQTGAVVL